jgi:TolB protein
MNAKQIIAALLVTFFIYSCSKTDSGTTPLPIVTTDSPKLFYVMDQSIGGILSYEIYSSYTDGTNEKKLTNFSNNGTIKKWAISPTFNADSTKIIFIQATGINDGKLMVMDLDGGNATAITANFGSGGIHDPQLYQNGQKILFWKDTLLAGAGGGYAVGQIFTANIDGTNLQKLTNSSGTGGAPDVDCFLGSLYNNKIIYLKLMPPMGGYGYEEIYSMNADGSNKQRLTTNNTDKNYARFSPDGSKIIYYGSANAAVHNGHSEIFIMNADGTNPQQLTNYSNNAALSTTAYYPCFSRDGKAIYYSSDWESIGQTAQVYKMNIDGTVKTKVTSGGTNSYKYDIIVK